ncbi:N-acetyltransferase [Kribbella pittospori]|uniref:N-acetyltransferase n=1 Tax=Kribbella pittospori TaxID=722689 RepID=A0A4V2M6S7_9ACTN|nr:GNAT family N-acetyltransferase [Kribbella pittospori]TCC44802.1 N-acetyltransferase [Kribbella pittospori]
MTILMDDHNGQILVVEDADLRYYELRLDSAVVGTLDFRDVEGRRVLGLTEIRPDRRGRGLATMLIRVVLDDLLRQGIRISNYCPAVDRFLRTHPDYYVVVDPARPGMTDSRTLHQAGPAESALDAAMRSEHARLRDLVDESRAGATPLTHRRHEADMFSAYAAQHLAATTELLLSHAGRSPAGDVAAYLGNIKQLEKSLRVLKGREYGDSRYLHLGLGEVWDVVMRLLSEHEELESRMTARIADEFDQGIVKSLAEELLLKQDKSPTRSHPSSPHVGAIGNLTRRLWRIADSTADDLEGRLVPARYHRNPKRDSSFSHYLRGTPIDGDDSAT